jgi:hypothetical protein
MIEGDYIFWIMKAEMNNGLLDVTFESRGERLAQSFPVSGPGVWRLKEMLEACGKKVKAKKMKLDLDKLIGLECGGTVLDQEEDGTTFSVISAFFPAEESVVFNEMQEMLAGVKKLEEEFIRCPRGWRK